VAAGVAAITAIGSNVLPVIWQSTGRPQILTVRYQREINDPDLGTLFTSTPIFRGEDLALLKSELSQVVAAADAPDNAYQLEVEVEGRRYVVQRAARVGPDYLQLLDVSLVEGSYFVADDFRQASADPGGAGGSVIISRELALVLFGSEQAVGKTISIGLQGGGASSARIDSRVVGVVEMPPLRDREALFGVYADLLLPASGAGGGSGASSSTTETVTVVAPSTGSTGQAEIEQAGPPQRSFSEFYVRTKTGDLERARREIVAALTPQIREREAESPFSVAPIPALPGGMVGDDMEEGTSTRASPQPPGEIRVEATQGWVVRAAVTAGIYLGGIALIALMVSGISLFTVTLVNLTEQRHSIGLRRALGASARWVVREAVDEGLVLAGAGGVLGVALSEPAGRFLLDPLLQGAGFSVAGNSAWRVSGYLDLRVAGIALLLSLVVGAVAALYPAWESSRLQPREAFRDDL